MLLIACDSKQTSWQLFKKGYGVKNQFALIVLFFLLYLIWGFPVTAEVKKRVVVLQFIGDAPEQALRSITDSAREGALDMLPPSKFTLMTQESTQVILEDMGIDIGCVEGQCEVDTLRNIQADYGVTGTVNQVAGQYELVMRLYESDSAALLASETKRYDQISEMLNDSKRTAKILIASGVPSAGLESGFTVSAVTIRKSEVYRGQNIVNKPSERKGYLYITSQPTGAEVFVNGESFGSAPLQKSVSEGEYVVVADMGAMYHQATSDRIKVFDGQTVNIPLILKPSFGKITVDSKPSGGKVYISGEQVGYTPYENSHQPSDIYNLQIQMDKYFTHQERIVVEDESDVKVFVNLERSLGELKISSKPAGASIWLRGYL